MPRRYPEDIDFVQVKPGPIGPILDAIRATLDPCLVPPAREQTEGGVKLAYRFASTSPPVQPMRLKVEINTREHGSVRPLRYRDFGVSSPWFAGNEDREG